MNDYRQAVRGNCFENSYNIIKALALAQPWRDYRLCHGIGIRTRPPHISMSHAWIEYNAGSCAYAIDHQFPTQSTPRERYYLTGGVDVASIKRYTPAEAEALLEQHNHYGAWDERIAAVQDGNQDQGFVPPTAGAKYDAGKQLWTPS